MSRHLILIILISLTACSSIKTETNETKIDGDSTGSFITGRSEQGVSLSDLTGNSAKGSSGIPVNALLWRASLDIASILPVDDIDVFSGTIISDWYSLPSTPNEQIKLAIFVLDKELRSDAIRVVVYVQSKKANIWEDAGLDSSLALQLEELILTRARELRASTVTQ
jgi:hypothetical protein